MTCDPDHCTDLVPDHLDAVVGIHGEEGVVDARDGLLLHLGGEERNTSVSHDTTPTERGYYSPETYHARHYLHSFEHKRTGRHANPVRIQLINDTIAQK